MQQIPWLNLEYFFNKFFQFIDNFIPWTISKFQQIFGVGVGALVYVVYVVIIIAGLGLAFVVFKIVEIKWLRKKVYFSDFFEKHETAIARKDTWGGIKKMIDGDNQDTWKMAVVEADTLVEGIMERIGYRGVTLGDKIKSIDEKNFASLKDLWEAHVVRMKIDREGAEYKITKEEAKEAIDKYEKALKELKYI